MKASEIPEINPGIVKLVQFLNDRGFKTTDSGDGNTRLYACDPGFPYVNIEVESSNLISEADRLHHLLIDELQIQMGFQNEEGTAKTIQADYHPAAQKAAILLMGVTDADL